MFIQKANKRANNQNTFIIKISSNQYYSHRHPLRANTKIKINLNKTLIITTIKITITIIEYQQQRRSYHYLKVNKKSDH